MPANIKGKTIKLYLADGTPEGLRIIEKSNWVGKAISCSKNQFPSVKKRSEFQKTGVYILIGRTESEDLRVYIGEGDPALERLEKHFREKDFWDQLILFISKDENLNKAHLQYLEARLIHMAIKAKRCSLENTKTPTLPTISESDESDMENFLEEMLLVYGALNLPIFEIPKATKQDVKVLKLKSYNAEASGADSEQGFIVFAGSKSPIEETPTCPEGTRAIRVQMIQDGLFVLKDGSYFLTQDYIFSSPSTAAGVFLARSANGRIEWKTTEGRSLKELQEEALRHSKD